MLNINYEAKTHRDKKNDGMSCVVAFGDFTGGELVVEDITYDIRHKPFKFFASTTPHSVNPITSGTRYSIVFFRPNFPKRFVAKYGSTLTYDQIEQLIPPRLPGQRASDVRVNETIEDFLTEEENEPELQDSDSFLSSSEVVHRKVAPSVETPQPIASSDCLCS
jgi:hypothetical protein